MLIRLQIDTESLITIVQMQKGVRAMTREEAIETIKTAIAEVEWEYPMNYAAAFEVAIKALEQKPILDKIRAEIETEKNAGCHTQYAGGLDFAMSIIDKYKAESEV